MKQTQCVGTTDPILADGDEPASNPSSNDYFGVQAHLSRRTLLGASLNAVVASAMATTLPFMSAFASNSGLTGPSPGFRAVPVSNADRVSVPKGYRVQTLIPWGTPISGAMFVNVQHPGATTEAEAFAASDLVSHWPDGGSAIPRSATLVISREDGGIIGA